MEIQTIVKEIQRLPLSKRFFVMEQTLKSIKKEELSHKKENFNNKEIDFPYSLSEVSLAQDWLSEEDNRWDNIL